MINSNLQQPVEKEDRIFNIRLIDIETFACIYLTTGFLVTANIIPSAVMIGLWLVLCLRFLFKGMDIQLNRIIVPILLCVLYLILYVFYESNLTTGFKNLFSFVTVLLYVVSNKPKAIAESIIRVMKLITAISLVLFVFHWLVPSYKGFMQHADTIGNRYYITLIFTHMVGHDRNCGIFWEPGVFQAFVNLTLLLELSKEKPDRNTIIILVLGVVTTFSASGYFALAAIALLYLVRSKDSLNKRLQQALILFLILFVVLLLFSEPILDMLNKTVFKKIIIFFEYKEYNNTRYTSASVRYFSIVKVFELFIKNPFFGVGKEAAKELTYTYLYNNLTCTFANWLGMYGIFYGGTLILGYYKYGKLLFGTTSNALLCLLCFFLITMSEDFSANAFYYIFPFIGFVYGNQVEQKQMKYRFRM